MITRFCHPALLPGSVLLLLKIRLPAMVLLVSADGSAATARSSSLLGPAPPLPLSPASVTLTGDPSSASLLRKPPLLPVLLQFLALLSPLAPSLSLPLSLSPTLPLCPPFCRSLAARKGKPHTRAGGDSSDESARPASPSSNCRRARRTLAGRGSSSSICSSSDERLRSFASCGCCSDASAPPCTRLCKNSTELPPSTSASVGDFGVPVAEKAPGSWIMTVSDTNFFFPSKRSDTVRLHLRCERERLGRTSRRQSCTATRVAANMDSSNQSDTGCYNVRSTHRER